MDTLKDDKYEQITRGQGFKNVWSGIECALKVGFDKIKLNCVVIRDFNHNELIDFAKLSRLYPIEVRFIEYMPFLSNKWSAKSLVSYKEMLVKINSGFSSNFKRVKQDLNETAKIFKEPGSPGSIGFITSLTDEFCSGCNRLRLTADGNLKVCLFGKAETSLRDLMRNGANDTEIRDAIQNALIGKARKHAGKTNLSSSYNNIL